MAWTSDEEGRILYKIVYYGPTARALADNLRRIGEVVRAPIAPPEVPRGEEQSRFFSLELTVGQFRGRRTDLWLQTVPAASAFPAHRLIVLKGADAVVFVMDRDERRMADNRRSVGELREHVVALGHEWERFRVVVQIEGPQAAPTTTAVAALSALGLSARPVVEADATSGAGVMDTMKAVVRAVLSE